MEEFGGAKVVEFAEHEGVWAVDWSNRVLKTEEASRHLPIHGAIIALGFRSYVDELERRGEVWLFPELPHPEGDDGTKATAAFGKWWAAWMNKHNLPQREIDFHALRHTFKRACRDAHISEETSDLITGHTGIGGVGRDYGKGMSLRPMADALAKVRFPTVALLCS